MSSLSLWLRDIPLTNKQRENLQARRSANSFARGKANRERRLAKEESIRRSAAIELGSVTDRDLFVAGVVAYAAEGCKQKPWQTGTVSKFINSDPRMILLFLRWLELIGVQKSSLTFRVAIHESADAPAAVAYWSRVVGVPAEVFHRTTLKREKPKTRRRNTGAEYRGCLVVTVRRSTDLTRRLEGLFEALVRGTEGRAGDSRAGTFATA
jgi:hypothetical protein